MSVNECPEHACNLVKLQKIKAIDLYQFKSTLNLNYFHPPITSKVDNSHGEELHKTMVTAFSIIFAKRTTAIGPIENLEVK